MKNFNWEIILPQHPSKSLQMHFDVCIHVLMCVGMCAALCGGSRLMLLSSSEPLLLMYWGRVSHTSLELARSAGSCHQLSLWFPCICLLSAGMTGRLSGLPGSYVVLLLQTLVLTLTQSPPSHLSSLQARPFVFYLISTHSKYYYLFIFR